MSVTLLGIVIVGKLVQYSNALLPMAVTLLSFAKATEVTVFWPSIQFAGIFPVIVEPTCPPEELKAFEVVMGSGVLGILKVVFFLIIRLILIIL
jgi:hypothetical protein